MFIQTRTGETVMEASYPAGEYCSSYTGECVAALKAVEWIKEQEKGRFAICTDSKSLYELILNDNWRDQDPWLKKIKQVIHKTESEIELVWIPSHCGIPGNDRADELANEGTRKDQKEIPVTHQIVKAKIKNRKWKVAHERALETYQERRMPRFEVEAKWSRRIRTEYARLRTGHSKNLKYYRYVIETEDDPICDQCGMEEETIDHVLCRCPALEEARVRQVNGGEVTISMMVTDPESCRKILATRFKELVFDPGGQ